MLVKKQQDFAIAIAKLILYAAEIGLPVTLGDAYRDPRVHGAMGVKIGYSLANSCHKIRLAVDLNIIKDGKIADISEYKKLQEYWRTHLGGSALIESDSNHFSWEHEGFR
jgi:hypothetical protein